MGKPQQELRSIVDMTMEANVIHDGQLRIIVEVVPRAPSDAFPTVEDALQWVLEEGLEPGDILMVIREDDSSSGGAAPERRWIVLTKTGTRTLLERVIVGVSRPVDEE